MAPQIPSGSAPQEVRIGLRMDGVTVLRNLSEVVTVHPNPEFAEFKDRSFSSSDTIKLTVGSKVSERERERERERGGEGQTDRQTDRERQKQQ